MVEDGKSYGTIVCCSYVISVREGRLVFIEAV